MAGSQTGEPPFDLNRLSPGCFKLVSGWGRLDVGACTRAGASVALSHGFAMIPDG
jgi:hypothetical protein